MITTIFAALALSATAVRVDQIDLATPGKLPAYNSLHQRATLLNLSPRLVMASAVAARSTSTAVVAAAVAAAMAATCSRMTAHTETADV